MATEQDHDSSRSAPTPANPEGEQREPLLEQNDASIADKVQGIVEQTRADVGNKSLDEVVTVLRERFADTGIELSGSEIEALGRQVIEGL